MTEEFTSITTEVLISGTWTNLTPDVRINPPPRVTGIGILGNSIMDRTGDIGTYEFTLDNSERNSVSTLGYYTPYGENMLTGWRAGLPVRLTFVYDGYTKCKYYGRIDPDGINVETGQYRGRSVKVRCSNWMSRAGMHTLELMQYQTNLRGDQGIQNVLDNMDIQPQAVHLGVGDTTFPTMFDITKSNTKAIGEIQKIVMSGLDYAFIRPGGETIGEELVFMPRSEWTAKFDPTTFPAKNSDFTDSILLESGGTDDLLNEDGSRILLEHAIDADFRQVAYQDNMTDLQVSYGKNMANHVVMRTYPRVVDTSDVVLWALESPITILAGETLTEIRGTYTDPNSGIAKVGGISMVTPVATTDYQMFQNANGTGTDRTADLVVSAGYGTSEVRYTLTNNNASDSYITKLQARGRGVYIYDPSEKVYDSTLQSTYGVIPLTIDMPYLDGVSSLFTLVDDKTFTGFYGGGIGEGLDDPEPVVDQVSFMVNTDSHKMLAFMFLEPSDVMQISETVTESEAVSDWWANPWHVIGYSFEILHGKYVKWMPTLKLVGRT